MNRLTYLQGLLDSLPRGVRVSIFKTDREGEQYGGRNVFGEKSSNHANWRAAVSVLERRGVELPEHPRYIIAHTSEVLYWVQHYQIPYHTYILQVDENDTGYISQREIFIESDHLGLLMLRVYRAGMWLAKHMGGE